MASDWDPGAARDQLGKILDRPYEHKNWQNCDAVIAMLPPALQPPYGAVPITVEDVLKRLFEGLLAPGDEASDEAKLHAAKPEMRAARAHLGWIKNEYDLICQVNQEAPLKRYKPPGPNASDQEREAYRVNLLKSPEIRRKLAAREMDPGLSTKQFKNTRRDLIADALINAIRILTMDQAAVDALANELRIKRSTALADSKPSSDAAVPTEEAILPIEAEPPPVESAPSASYSRAPGLARRYLVAAVLCLVVGGIAAISWIVISGHTRGSGTGQTGANSSTGQTTPPAQTIPVSITDPPKLSPAASVPHDIVVAGPGSPEPSGYHRWIFVHAADGKYYPQPGREINENNTWKIAGVTIGEEGTVDDGYTFTVYVLQVDDTTDKKLTDYMTSFSPGFAAYSQDDWTNNFLRFKLDEVTVQRTG